LPLSSLYQPEKTWLNLSEGFSDPVEPAEFPKKIIRFRNQESAFTVGLDSLTDDEWLKYFCLFKPLPNSLPKSLALRYHGHQFTHYNPDLGDGRGFLFAQLRDSNKCLLDLGTKGTGQTPYSRRGDGRLTLKGAVREALATSFLESRGVNTSKTFSIVETGENLFRNDEPSPTRSAVLVRLSQSHIRFGTFQRLAYLDEKQKINELIEYCLTNYYSQTNRENFFNEVCKNVALTTAQWMIHGFVHGVLNTDNMNITGESFDYGPYRFLPHYEPQFTAAYFDKESLYAYGKQPQMVMWNLERLKESLELVNGNLDSYMQGFETFKIEFEKNLMQLFCKKMGVLENKDPRKTKNLFLLCLQFLEKSKAPYEEFFHHLYCWHQDFNQPLKNYNLNLYDNDDIEEIEKLLATFIRDPKASIKKVSGLETLLIDEIEKIWNEIDKKDDWSLFNNKITNLKK
jgi:serine/tyrosine/threonine adenylyltransferase